MIEAKRDVGFITTLANNESDYAGCKYCLTCGYSHGPLFNCPNYTGAERLDQELAGIRHRRAARDGTLRLIYCTFEEMNT